MALLYGIAPLRPPSELYSTKDKAIPRTDQYKSHYFHMIADLSHEETSHSKMQVFTPANLVAAICLFPIYLFGLAIYRLYFHPLHRFPGPFAAGLTYWTEFYYDVVLRGQYMWRIQEWHEKYGPIIRISPDELHIADSHFYDTLYAGTSARRRIDKWLPQTKAFGTGLSAFGTAPHDLHKSRRAAIAPLLSKRAVTQLEPLIQETVYEMMSKLRRLKGTGTPVNLFDTFSCFTADVISIYSFGKSLGFLERDDFAPEWHSLIDDFAALGAVGKQFGFVWPLFDTLPSWLVEWANPPMSHVVGLNRLISQRIEAIRKQRSSSPDKAETLPHRTIFDDVLDSDLPPDEKSKRRMMDEGNVLMSAGTATTADTLAVTCFYVANNSSIRMRLSEELASVVSRSTGRPSWQELEQLPYLTAVMKEGLRVTTGVLARLARIDPDNAIQFREWTIPCGTPVSMDAYTVHYDSTIFAQPTDFLPERWLTGQNTDQAESGRLENHLVAFSKGTRQCIGMNLAYAELYLVLAAIFAPSGVDLELYETSDKDVEIVRDIFVPGFRDGTKGVRVLVK